jgi:transposase
MGRPRKRREPNAAVIRAGALADVKRDLDARFEIALWEASQSASLREIADAVGLSAETVRRIVMKINREAPGAARAARDREGEE